MRQLNAEGAQDSPGNTLYLRFASTILTYLSQQVANFQDAEDLLLEVFIAAFKYERLADLPADQARLIAHGNAERLYGGKIEP